MGLIPDTSHTLLPANRSNKKTRKLTFKISQMQLLASGSMSSDGRCKHRKLTMSTIQIFVPLYNISPAFVTSHKEWYEHDPYSNSQFIGWIYTDNVYVCRWRQWDSAAWANIMLKHTRIRWIVIHKVCNAPNLKLIKPHAVCQLGISENLSSVSFVTRSTIRNIHESATEGAFLTVLDLGMWL